jgi:hypothetical protein
MGASTPIFKYGTAEISIYQDYKSSYRIKLRIDNPYSGNNMVSDGWWWGNV